MLQAAALGASVSETRAPLRGLSLPHTGPWPRAEFVSLHLVVAGVHAHWVFRAASVPTSKDGRPRPGPELDHPHPGKLLAESRC